MALTPEKDKTTNLKIGSVIAGRYEILSSLGQGAMGSVYKARQVQLDKLVALKVLHKSVLHNHEVVERFKREGKAAAAISHANVCGVLDFDELDDGGLFLVMEYLEGETLGQRINRQGKLPAKEAVEIVAQILSGLHQAHSLGIVHRDIKPDNIFITQQDNSPEIVKLVDFGIAHIDNSTQDDPKNSDITKLTQAGKLYGTPQYLSPEQAQCHPTDYRCDLYAVGIILHELLTGKPPFIGENLMQLMNMHVFSRRPKLKDIDANIRCVEDLDDVIDHLMEKKAENRYESAQEALDDLLSIRKDLDTTISNPGVINGLPLLSHVGATSPMLKAKRNQRSRRTRIITVSISVVSSIVLILLAVFFIYSQDDTPTAVVPKKKTTTEINADPSGFVMNSGMMLSQDPILGKDQQMIAAAEQMLLGNWEQSLELLNAQNDRYKDNLNFVKLHAITHYHLNNIDQTFAAFDKILKKYPPAALDRTLSEILLALLRNKQHAEQTRSFIEDHITIFMAEGFAIPLIESRVGAHPAQIELIIQILEDERLFQELDRWLQLSLDLRAHDRSSCREREKILKRLILLGDAQAWQAIKPFENSSQRGCRKRGKRTDCHACIRDELQQAKELFAPTPVVKTPPVTIGQKLAIILGIQPSKEEITSKDNGSSASKS